MGAIASLSELLRIGAKITAFPGRSAARSGALQTRDRNKRCVWNDPGCGAPLRAAPHPGNKAYLSAYELLRGYWPHREMTLSYHSRKATEETCSQIGLRPKWTCGIGGKTMKNAALPAESASALIDKRIAELGDWRGKTLRRIRELIREADPEIVEEWKWRGTPVWSHAGIICTGETHKSIVKMTFAKGASLKDPAHLFNSSLDGNVRRAIDIREDEKIDEAALKTLIRAAVALNLKGKRSG
jgi:hypothetical protein